MPLLRRRRKSSFRRKIHAYARTDVWHARSLAFRRSRAFICQGCGRQDRRNHAHHLSYARAFKGMEPDSDLMVLCADCHRKCHDYVRRHSGTLRASTYAWLGARR